MLLGMLGAQSLLAQVTPQQIALFLAAAFVPALLYLVIVRNSERYGRERWSRVLGLFLYGAVLGVFLAWLGSVALLLAVTQAAPWVPPVFLATVVIAPVVEELAKAFGLRFARREIHRAADGIVFAAAAGLGFAATENLLYQVIAYGQGGYGAWFALVIGRALSTTLVHPAATAIIGWAYGRGRERGHHGVALVLAYFAAVLLHAVYNYLVAFFPIVDIAGMPIPIGYPLAVGLAITSFLMISYTLRRRTRRAPSRRGRPI